MISMLYIEGYNRVREVLHQHTQWLSELVFGGRGILERLPREAST